MADAILAFLLIVASWLSDPVHLFFPPSEHDTAKCVRYWESRDVPAAVGRLGELGWFQINPAEDAHAVLVQRLGGPAVLFNPWVNTAVARLLWDQRGWQPWKSVLHLCQAKGVAHEGTSTMNQEIT